MARALVRAVCEQPDAGLRTGFRQAAPVGSDFFGRPNISNVILFSSCNIHSYMMYGWETGILNEFITLRRNGMPTEQIMELVMFAQLYAGMRGLGHVFRAVGETLPAYGPPPVPLPPFPEG